MLPYKASVKYVQFVTVICTCYAEDKRLGIQWQPWKLKFLYHLDTVYAVIFYYLYYPADLYSI